MPLSIRSRLMLLVLSVLLPTALAAGVLIVRAVDAERQALERNLRDSTRALARVVDGELAQRAAIARVLALSRMLDGAPTIATEDLQAFEQQARGAMAGLQGWVELRQAGGGELLSTAAVASAVGAVAAPPKAGFTLDDAPRIGQLGKGFDGSTLSAGIVQPVQRGGRTVLNVVIAILPSELQTIVDRQALPEGWVAAVLDGSGTVVARQPGGAGYAGRSPTAELLRRLASQKEALFDTVSLDGNPVVAYYSKSERGWTYLTAVPRPSQAGLTSSVVLPLLLGSALLLGLSITAALWVSRRIAEPVHALKLAAAKMQAGDAVAVQSTGIAECDEVSAALASASVAMQNARGDLERQVADAVERTQQAEQRASQSQRIEALGRLTGGVAHDFNNLLGIVSTSAHLIQRRSADPELQAPVAATLRAVNQGSQMVQRLLRFAGRQPLHPEGVDLHQQLPEMQDLLRMVLGRRVSISTEVAPGTHDVRADAGELELALINLGLNARDAMPAGGELILRAHNADAEDSAGLAEGRYVLIAVSDTGAGLAPEVAERAFEPFFTTKAEGEGRGLGLSQVHGFCVQAGGTARLSSTPGLGTTVCMLLPASDGVGSAAPDEQASSGGAAARTALRVLLVDDNDELAEATSELLSAYGLDVSRVPGPQQALALAAASAFDVVLSDVVMPGPMNGVLLAQRLREQNPDLPVVLISGYSDALADAGDLPVLAKPCAPDLLVRTLQQAVAKRRR